MHRLVVNRRDIPHQEGAGDTLKTGKALTGADVLGGNAAFHHPSRGLHVGFLHAQGIVLFVGQFGFREGRRLVYIAEVRGISAVFRHFLTGCLYCPLEALQWCPIGAVGLLERLHVPHRCNAFRVIPGVDHLIVFHHRVGLQALFAHNLGRHVFRVGHVRAVTCRVELPGVERANNAFAFDTTTLPTTFIDTVAKVGTQVRAVCIQQHRAAGFCAEEHHFATKIQHWTRLPYGQLITVGHDKPAKRHRHGGTWFRHY